MMVRTAAVPVCRPADVVRMRSRVRGAVQRTIRMAREFRPAGRSRELGEARGRQGLPDQALNGPHLLLLLGHGKGDGMTPGPGPRA